MMTDEDVHKVARVVKAIPLLQGLPSLGRLRNWKGADTIVDPRGFLRRVGLKNWKGADTFIDLQGWISRVGHEPRMLAAATNLLDVQYRQAVFEFLYTLSDNGFRSEQVQGLLSQLKAIDEWRSGGADEDALPRTTAPSKEDDHSVVAFAKANLRHLSEPCTQNLSFDASHITQGLAAYTVLDSKDCCKLFCNFIAQPAAELYIQAPFIDIWTVGFRV
jgi:hypothetical protein